MASRPFTGIECGRHGLTEFWLEARGIYRCLRCRSEAVARRRRRLKEILVADAGGACSICGYDRYPPLARSAEAEHDPG
jgi:DNA-directed RNA polymerase subunit RPC12/RpoP